MKKQFVRVYYIELYRVMKSLVLGGVFLDAYAACVLFFKMGMGICMTRKDVVSAAVGMSAGQRCRNNNRKSFRHFFTFNILMCKKTRAKKFITETYS
jgi:hypothetical protein